MKTRAASWARWTVLAAALPVMALALGACGSVGYVDEGDRQAGRELFISQCGQCHALAEAGTRGQIGPDLDDAFREARKDGMTEETVVQVVRGQIQYPIEEPVTGAPGMPGIDETLPECEGEERQGCVEDQGEAANSISVYVANVAGIEQPGGGPPAAPPPPPPPPATTTEPGDGAAAPDGKQVFASAGCGTCHTFADAGTSGTVGPNLDESRPSKELAVDRVTNGQGAMPPFKGQLSEAEIDAVAEYVSSAAGG